MQLATLHPSTRRNLSAVVRFSISCVLSAGSRCHLATARPDASSSSAMSTTPDRICCARLPSLTLSPRAASTPFAHSSVADVVSAAAPGAGIAARGGGGGGAALTATGGAGGAGLCCIGCCIGGGGICGRAGRGGTRGKGTSGSVRVGLRKPLPSATASGSSARRYTRRAVGDATHVAARSKMLVSGGSFASAISPTAVPGLLSRYSYSPYCSIAIGPACATNSNCAGK